jgi:hypothetical protein
VSAIGRRKGEGVLIDLMPRYGGTTASNLLMSATDHGSLLWSKSDFTGMTASGPNRQLEAGQSMSALPR